MKQVKWLQLSRAGSPFRQVITSTLTMYCLTGDPLYVVEEQYKANNGDKSSTHWLLPCEMGGV